MILSRPYADEDEMLEDIRHFNDWAKRRFGCWADQTPVEEDDDDDA